MDTIAQAEKNDAMLADDDFFCQLRAKEYARIDAAHHTYLDYTGGNLYAASQVLQHQQMLLNSVLGNPHSTNPTSQQATHLVEEARAKVISFFNAQDYICVFTQNASAALKIVGESYPFDKESAFLLLADNHNSVNGIRDFCKSKGGTVQYIPVQYEDLMINEELMKDTLLEFSGYQNKLFAMPAQSNVSGVKHDLGWIKKVQDFGFDVMLDAAAFVPSNRLDLSTIKPDFVCVSFYKIFGYPTGIGCLLIHKDKFHKLAKPWFAGGTVSIVTVANQTKILAEGHERFEDGTLNYLDIPAINIGLNYIESIGIERIHNRVNSLTRYLISALQQLKHNNGKALVKIFGPENMEARGGNVIMNFFDPEGQVYPFDAVEAFANSQMISIRSGCFCNPGIDEINNCITNDDLSQYFTGRENFNYFDMITTLGKMRGATRASVGIATCKKDIDNYVALISKLLNQPVSFLSKTNLTTKEKVW